MDATIIWDLEGDPDGNVHHLREHDVTIEEAEEVLLDPQSSRAVSRTSGLPTAFGWTSTGRHLAVVYELVDHDPLTFPSGHGLRHAAACPEEETEEEMKAQRIFRPSRKTAEERVREQTLRDTLQKEKPSLEDLIHAGTCDPDAVMTMGMYVDVQKALKALKGERERCALSIADVAERSGLDRAVVSRLENGKQDNPTVATLMRYAAAIGKRFVWSYENLAPKVVDSNGKAGRRRTKPSAKVPER